MKNSIDVNKMVSRICALGCPPTESLYIFPSRKSDEKRRKIWLDFFDMEEPNIDVFACSRHFSQIQTSKKGINSNAIPDVPIICDVLTSPFRRKTKTWSKNVIVVTPRDPEFSIYRRKTGVFPQNLFEVSKISPPILQMPINNLTSCTMPSNTNTRFCGSVEISNITEEYHLNCFYCCKIFLLEKWSNFVDHLKNQHFEREEAFKTSRYILQDHDYVSKDSTSSTSVKPEIKLNMISNTMIQVPSSDPECKERTKLPPLLTKSQDFNDLKISPPLLFAKPKQPQNKKDFNISLADQLIKLLNETILKPNFLLTDEDNVVIIKNTGSKNIETSNFLTNFMNVKTSMQPSCSTKPNNPTPLTSPSKYTRPIYTLNYGQQNIPNRRHLLSGAYLPTLPKNKKARLVQKRLARQTLKNINVFESVYNTVKKRPPKVTNFKATILKSPNISKETPKQTPLSRFLKRTITEANETEQETKQLAIERIKQKSLEIVFEYTPKDIVFALLENMKNFPVLWEFHDTPFNIVYVKAIKEICEIINSKWSLYITTVKMRRSVNRILRFYRFMLPCENLDQFTEYFEKCALFLPSSADEIPRARCVYCCICYKKDVELRKHLIKKHKCLKWPFKCPHCLERFRECDEYELHKYLPHYLETFKCEQCSKRFNRRHLYNKHVSAHKRTIERRLEQSLVPSKYSQVQCSVCTKIFKSMSELRRHEINHGEKIYKCHLCPKAYALKTTLKLHLKRHCKELDFMCEVCGKGFIGEAYLNEHMNTHTGAKITCNICNLKLRKCNLSRHLRLVHVATEGTIKSTIRARCYHYKKFLNINTPSTFATKKRVKRCEKLPRQYDCKICKIHFDRLKLLKDHNKLVHSNVQMFSCKMCQIEFKYVQNLKRHYRSKHNLHMYQIFKLVDQNEDLNEVLAIKTEQLDSKTKLDCIAYTSNKQQEPNPNDRNFFGTGRMNSDKIQDEIMKAVENIDGQKIKVDDDHSINEFFTDFLKQ